MAELIEGHRQPSFGEQRRVDPLGQLAKLLEGEGERLAGFAYECRGLTRALGQLGLEQAQRHRDRDETLLRAVVQVALDPPPLDVGRFDEAGTRRLKLRELCAQLRMEA